LSTGSAHAARAQPQADVAVMRESSGQIAPNVIESVDAALLRALGEVAGIRKPTLSPVAYGEVQLTVGCSDESNACLAAITHIAEADAVVVRHLSVEPDGTVALRILYFDEAGGPAHVRAAVLADHVQELAQAVPDLVRRLFEIPEPPPQGVSAAIAAGAGMSPPVAIAASVSTPATTDRGTPISTLTWVALGAGVATLGTGIVLGITAQSDYDDLNNTPVHTPSEADDANEQFSSITTRGTLANVLIPAGAVVLGAGAVLMGIDLLAHDSDAEATQARVQLIPLPSGGAVSVRGRFGGAL
jgi:hypothetical protein